MIETPQNEGEKEEKTKEKPKDRPLTLNPPNDMFEDDADDITFNVDDRDIKKREIFLTVGLNSNISAKDFQRKKLNLCVLLDISGSMNKPFTNDKVSTSKIDVAKKAILALVMNLNHDDRFSLVSFNRNAQTQIGLAKLSEHELNTFRNIQHIYASGGTNFEAGYSAAIQIFEQFYRTQKGYESKMKDLEEYDNRIMVLTDMNPNLGKRDPQKLMEMVEKYSKNEEMRIYTSFIGIGLDFNSDLAMKISSIRGANHCDVHSNDEFVKRMGEEFDYMVSPLVFDFSLTLKSEGDVAYIDQVWGAGGSGADALKKGEIMKIDTLFPSPPSQETGEKKGGIVLLKVKRKDNGDDALKSFNMMIECKFEDKYGKKYNNKQLVQFGDENKFNQQDYFDNYGVQKGILLARYTTLMQHWMKHDQYFYLNKTKKKTKTTKSLFVSPRFKKIFESFKTYFIQQSKLIND